MNAYLAVDTVTDHGSVALGTPGGVDAEVTIGRRKHAAALLPSIEHVLRMARASYADLQGIVVADGPGSFTGLRIGFATVKGIMQEYESLELRSAPSLMSLAFGMRHCANGPVCALYDALRGDVFGAVYGFSAGAVSVELNPTLGTVTQLTELCSVKPSLGVGDGAAAYATLVREWTGSEPIGPPAAVPRAAGLLGLLAVDGATTLVADPESFEPEYGRLAEAQVRLAQRQRGAG